jgi:hypothetical protein
VSNETIQTDFYSHGEVNRRTDSRPNPSPIQAGRDHRDASMQMLAASTAAVASQTMVSARPIRVTCRHFRYRLPRVDADELRSADPTPCAVCDATPLRKFRMIQWFA